MLAPSGTCPAPSSTQHYPAPSGTQHYPAPSTYNPARTCACVSVLLITPASVQLTLAPSSTCLALSSTQHYPAPSGPQHYPAPSTYNPACTCSSVLLTLALVSCSSLCHLAPYWHHLAPVWHHPAPYWHHPPPNTIQHHPAPNIIKHHPLIILLIIIQFIIGAE